MQVKAERPPARPPGKPGQHLLRHAVTPEASAAAVEHLGADPVAAGEAIWRLRHARGLDGMAFLPRVESPTTSEPRRPHLHAPPPGARRPLTAALPARLAARCLCCRQPELRVMFSKVFGVPTQSGNNGERLLAGPPSRRAALACVCVVALCHAAPRPLTATHVPCPAALRPGMQTGCAASCCKVGSACKEWCH